LAEQRSTPWCILHARGAIKPEARERWFALLEAVTAPSRAEDAFQSYVLYEAIETPNFTEFFAGLGRYSQGRLRGQSPRCRQR
jgi:hypothetical protein